MALILLGILVVLTGFAALRYRPSAQRDAEPIDHELANYHGAVLTFGLTAVLSLAVVLVLVIR